MDLSIRFVPGFSLFQTFPSNKLTLKAVCTMSTKHKHRKFYRAQPFLYLPVLVYACLSCKTSLASLCRGHANWTVKKHRNRFMLQCSPFNRDCATALCILEGLGARADHRDHIYHNPALWDQSRCQSSLEQAVLNLRMFKWVRVKQPLQWTKM